MLGRNGEPGPMEVGIQISRTYGAKCKTPSDRSQGPREGSCRDASHRGSHRFVGDAGTGELK